MHGNGEAGFVHHLDRYKAIRAVFMSSIIVNEICAMEIKNHGKTKENTIDMLA